MVIPGTQHHAWVIQSKSPSHARRVSRQQAGAAAGGSGLHTDGSGTSGRDRQKSTIDMREELGHPAQQKVPSAINSRVPLGLWASIWAAHKIWLLKEDESIKEVLAVRPLAPDAVSEIAVRSAGPFARVSWASEAPEAGEWLFRHRTTRPVFEVS